MTRYTILTAHPHDPTPRNTLTRTQRSALDTLTTGDRRLWPDHPYRRVTLDALVAGGWAAWRGSTFETPHRHGVLPHVVLLDRESSGSRQYYIETGLYLTHEEAEEYAVPEPVAAGQDDRGDIVGFRDGSPIRRHPDHGKRSTDPADVLARVRGLADDWRQRATELDAAVGDDDDMVGDDGETQAARAAADTYADLAAALTATLDGTG